MAKSKKTEQKSRFLITGRVTILTSLTVAAENYTEALEKATTLSREDFVTGGDLFDSKTEIISISKEDGYNL